MSIYLEERPDGGRTLYIEGDLQFDTSDEALYHEALALPALCVARRRFGSRSLSVLICGGGDGLALRETLRFPGIAKVDLVDYSEEIVTLARTQLAMLNRNAFDDPRVSTHIEDAWRFLSSQSVDERYDVILCDFTVPRRPGDSRVFSREWFDLLHDRLRQDGVVAVNSLSPQGTPEAFWCLEKTIRTVGFSAVPYRVCIPSFHDNGYGIWSFSLCARSLRLRELRDLNCPIESRQANLAELWRGALFSSSERALGRRAPVNTLDNDILLSLLLNPGLSADFSDRLSDASLDSPYDLEPLIQSIPILHPYHTRAMVDTLARQVTRAIKSIDLRMLIDALLKRASELPQRLRNELVKLKEYLRDHFDSIDDWGIWCYRLFAVLVIIITIANSIAPDSAFAKGGFGGGHAGGYSAGMGEHSFGMFGRPGGFGAAHGPADLSSARITSGGFRSHPSSSYMEDIEGRQYPLRTYYYRPMGWGRGDYYNTGYNSYPMNTNAVNTANTPAQYKHEPVFVANSDLLVLENGDIVVNLSEKAYLLVSNGHIGLMVNGSSEPLALVYHDPGLRNSLIEDLSAQEKILGLEMDSRKEWLSWVGWTGAVVESVRNDETEYDNLVETRRRVGDALKNLDNLKPAAATPPISAGTGAVQLFAGAQAQLGSNGMLSIHTESGDWLNTDGARVWRNSNIDAARPAGALSGAIGDIIGKRITENTADIASINDGLRDLNSDMQSLNHDLQEYQSIYSQYGDPNYEVDYGSDEISVSDAINRTNADIASCGAEIKKAAADSENLSRELITLRWAQNNFVAKK